VSRAEWLAARSCNWQPIWLWPAAAALAVMLVFVVGFRDPAADQAGRAAPEKA
jgi:hypothetical protein